MHLPRHRDRPRGHRTRSSPERLDKAVRDAPVGDPFADVVYGPMLSQRFADRFEEYLTWIQPHHRVFGSAGIGRITSQNPRPGFVGDAETGLYYHPVIVAGVREDDALFRQETFGPIIGLTTYRDLDEAIRLANAPGYGLSSSIYTRDPAEAFRFRRGISAGMVSVNNSTSGAEAHLPFGGNGRSGNGSRQSGMWVLDQFTRWQSMNWDYSGVLQKAQMDITELTPDESFRPRRLTSGAEEHCARDWPRAVASTSPSSTRGDRERTAGLRAQPPTLTRPSRKVRIGISVADDGDRSRPSDAAEVTAFPIDEMVWARRQGSASGHFLADHVLVDEGQDRRPAHWQLLRVLADEARARRRPVHRRGLSPADYGQHVVLSQFGIRIVGRYSA